MKKLLLFGLLLSIMVISGCFGWWGWRGRGREGRGYDRGHGGGSITIEEHSDHHDRGDR